MSVYKFHKYAERLVASILGGKRNTYDKGSNAVDVEHEWLGVEVKSREKLPDWLIAALAQAEANAPTGKLPIVCLAEKRGIHLAVLRLETFAEWFVNKGEV